MEAGGSSLGKKSDTFVRDLSCFLGFASTDERDTLPQIRDLCVGGFSKRVTNFDLKSLRC